MSFTFDFCTKQIVLSRLSREENHHLKSIKEEKCKDEVEITACVRNCFLKFPFFKKSVYRLFLRKKTSPDFDVDATPSANG